MAQTSLLNSQSVANLDATPIVPNTSGEGASAPLLAISDMVTALSADAAGSTYAFVRIPTSAHIKSVKLYSQVASAGAADINIRFSDADLVGLMDGTPTSLAGTIPQMSSANNKLFGA